MNLITPVEVIAKAHVDHNMDPKVFCSHIVVAETKLSDADAAFGTELYDEIVADLISFTDYDSTSVYDTDDKVLFQGKYFKALADGTTNILPTVGASWAVVDKFTTAKYQTLWDKHLWMILALMVQHTSTFTNSVRTTAQGEVVNSTNNSEGASFNSVKAKKEELSDNIRILEKGMDAFLIKNKTDYPLYKGNKDCGAKRDSRPSLGVYLKRIK